MPNRIRGLAAILVLGLCTSGCAASMGSVAGNVLGGAAWGAMKGGKLAWKGGEFAAKATGKTVVGAAKGVHEEFSPQDSHAPGAGPSGLSSEDSTLINDAKDVGPVASSQAKGAALTN
jgi:hypothetical protein